MRLRLYVLPLLLTLGAVAPAAAEGPNPLQSADLKKYEYDPTKQLAVTVGRDFLADLTAVNKPLRAAVTDAVRYEIQAEETAKFTRQRKFVIAAYAVLFVVLAGFTTTLWLRQRKLLAELADLEARLRDGAGGKAA